MLLKVYRKFFCNLCIMVSEYYDSNIMNRETTCVNSIKHFVKKFSTGNKLAFRQRA